MGGIEDNVRYCRAASRYPGIVYFGTCYTAVHYFADTTWCWSVPSYFRAIDTVRHHLGDNASQARLRALGTGGAHPRLIAKFFWSVVIDTVRHRLDRQCQPGSVASLMSRSCVALIRVSTWVKVFRVFRSPPGMGLQERVRAIPDSQECIDTASEYVPHRQA
jgi:hypothetical protein